MQPEKEANNNRRLHFPRFLSFFFSLPLSKAPLASLRFPSSALLLASSARYTSLARSSASHASSISLKKNPASLSFSSSPAVRLTRKKEKETKETERRCVLNGDVTSAVRATGVESNKRKEGQRAKAGSIFSCRAGLGSASAVAPFERLFCRSRDSAVSALVAVVEKSKCDRGKKKRRRGRGKGRVREKK